MQFRFKAKQIKDGSIVENIRESDDKFSLARELKAEGLTLLVVNEANSRGTMEFLIWLNGIVTTINLHEKIIFARNLSAMISAGLSLNRAIEILEKQTQNEKFKKILNDIGEEIKKGGTLSSGLKKYPRVFSPLFIAMVNAGEESGGLSPALKEVSMHLEKSYVMMKKVKGAMMYPAIIMVAIVIIGALMLIYVVPTLTGTFKELKVELPASTKSIIFVSDFLVQHTILFIGSILAFALSFFFGLKTKIGQKYFDFVILRIPFIGNLVKEVNSARTTRTLSSLLTAGVTVTEAISITKDVIQNYYYKEVLTEAVVTIQKGSPIAKVFKDNVNLFPVMVGEMVEVGEETGKLSQMLMDIALFYEEEVDTATKDLSTIIEPVLMVFIGGAVGFFAISMISPTYSLLNNI